MSEKISKVAICEKCGSFVKACHTDFAEMEEFKKAFLRLEHEGFIIKIETAEETKARNWSILDEYEKCKRGECNSPEILLKYAE